MSSEVKVPFAISAGTARLFGATEVCYDGSSCLLFNNIEDVKACTINLAKNSSCRFEISANQNLGVTQAVCWFRPLEVSEAASKLTAIIDGVDMMLRYSSCSKAGEKCAVIAKERDPTAKSDPNEKYCFDGSGVTTQSCCLKEKARKSDGALNGNWAKPGIPCG